MQVEDKTRWSSSKTNESDEAAAKTCLDIGELSTFGFFIVRQRDSDDNPHFPFSLWRRRTSRVGCSGRPPAIMHAMSSNQNEGKSAYDAG